MTAAEVPDFVAEPLPVGVGAEDVLPLAIADSDAREISKLAVDACSEVLDSMDVESVNSVLGEELVLVIVEVSDVVVCSVVNNAVDGTE